MKACWNAKQEKRPPLREACNILSDELASLENKSRNRFADRTMHLRDDSMRSLHGHVGRSSSILDLTALRTISFYRPGDKNLSKQVSITGVTDIDDEDENEQREMLVRLTTNTPNVADQVFEWMPLFGGTMEVELPLNWDLLSSSSFKESKEVWQDASSSLILRLMLVDKQSVPKNEDVASFYFQQAADGYKIPKSARHHAPISSDGLEIPALPDAVLWCGKGTLDDGEKDGTGRVYQLEQCIVRLSKKEKDLAVCLTGVLDPKLPKDKLSPLFCRLLTSLRVQNWDLFESTPTRHSIEATS